MPGLELLIRVGLATVLGIIIGIERQWRARVAGLQTMALVCMGAALFLILGAYTFRPEPNPTQVAAQIVTGVGFLGAGVIMKQGFSVTGLNTAATLWATAAVGALAGAWMWREAITGAAIIVVGNTFLHPLATRMDRARTRAGREIPPADYVFEVVCTSDAEPNVRTLLTPALTRSNFQLSSMRATATTNPNEIALRIELSAAARDDAVMEDAIRTLSVDPAVRSVSWTTGSN
ncbi:MgtC/SapB family protein [Smaragdicoccus niigatensis]|uniref:MgtC/SapB family protein n=1 Tax=Smaragdicoccus niigatensis TaxID=359359 RepID=UPI00047657F3|nr:MgtC/SapB family protein [Smaragdicoccus niigatensis]